MNLSILIPRRKRKASRPNLLRRIECAISRAYQRHMNYRYYLRQGLPKQMARELAEVTL